MKTLKDLKTWINSLPEEELDGGIFMRDRNDNIWSAQEGKPYNFGVDMFSVEGEDELYTMRDALNAEF